MGTPYLFKGTLYLNFLMRYLDLDLEINSGPETKLDGSISAC